jgi:hypothetical protein
MSDIHCLQTYEYVCHGYVWKVSAERKKRVGGCDRISEEKMAELRKK